MADGLDYRTGAPATYQQIMTGPLAPADFGYVPPLEGGPHGAVSAEMAALQAELDDCIPLIALRAEGPYLETTMNMTAIRSAVADALEKQGHPNQSFLREIREGKRDDGPYVQGAVARAERWAAPRP